MNVLDWTGISYPFRIENGSVAKSKSVLNPKDGKSDHINESIEQIVTTTFGEWITKNNIGTKFRKLSFNLFSFDFDSYIIYNLTECIETQDKRVKIISIKIDRIKEQSMIAISVKWDINKDIVKTYAETNPITTVVEINVGDVEGGS